MEVVLDWFLIVSIEETSINNVLEFIYIVAVARILFGHHVGARGFVW